MAHNLKKHAQRRAQRKLRQAEPFDIAAALRRAVAAFAKDDHLEIEGSNLGDSPADCDGCCMDLPASRACNESACVLVSARKLATRTARVSMLWVATEEHPGGWQDVDEVGLCRLCAVDPTITERLLADKGVSIQIWDRLQGDFEDAAKLGPDGALYRNGWQCVGLAEDAAKERETMAREWRRRLEQTLKDSGRQERETANKLLDEQWKDVIDGVDHCGELLARKVLTLQQYNTMVDQYIRCLREGLSPHGNVFPLSWGKSA